MTGTLITLEGIDGAGKTTLAHGLLAALRDRGITAVMLREPGGVAVAEAIRELVRDRSLTIGTRAEALLFAAARAQLVEEALVPRLAAGAFVLLDRFVDSSLVYQGTGRGLGRDAIGAINAFATGALEPDRTLLLTLDPGLATERARSRAAATDRIESEAAAFFARIDAGYRELARAHPSRIVTIDAARAPEAVLSDALAALSDLIDRHAHDGPSAGSGSVPA